MRQRDLEDLEFGYYWATIVVDERRGEHQHLVVAVVERPVDCDQTYLGHPVASHMQKALMGLGSENPLDVSKVFVTGHIDHRRRLDRSLTQAREYAEAHRDRADSQNKYKLPWEDGFNPNQHDPRRQPLVFGGVNVGPDQWAFGEFTPADEGYHAMIDTVAHAGPARTREGAVKALRAYLEGEGHNTVSQFRLVHVDRSGKPTVIVVGR